MKTPYEYQTEAIRLASLRNILLADECGLGKTIVAIETIKRLRAHGVELPALIVTPKSVGPQWVQELIDQGISPDSIQLVGRGGVGFPHAPAPDAIVITHYEALVKQFKHAHQVTWGIVVCDEAHRIKNRHSKRTQAVKTLHTLYKLALTGTPMEKSPADLWSVLHWLYPDRFRSYWAWYEKYVDETVTWAGYRKINGAKNAEEMMTRISDIFMRRTKVDVAPQLPPRIMQRVGLTMTPHQKTFYDKIAKATDIEVNLKDDEESLLIPNVLAKIVRLQQISSDPRLLGVDIDSPKIEWVKDFVEDNPEEDIVIFSKFRDTADRLSSVLHADLITGQRKGGVLFAQGSTHVLVGTIAAMGEGLNLQKATTAIFLDQEWSSIKMQQAIDRVHRINDTRPKHIIYLYTERTVDTLVLKALDQKWSVNEMVYRYLEETEAE